jgi:putative iron-dependent peroxidase
MSTPQPGILADCPRHARYLTFACGDNDRVRDALADLREVADGDAIVVGIGESLARALGVHVPGLTTFPRIAGPAGVDVPSTPGALWLWLRGEDRGELLHESRQVEAALAPAFQLDAVVDAFQHRDSRDLTGYEDGTENPQGAAAVAAAIVAAGPLAGSSFVAVQQWLHDFHRFDAMSDDEQDACIGRRRSDNEELDDAPDSAHVKRTAQESFDPEAFVWRRSMPWSDGQRGGLVFVAFGASFAPFAAQLHRMTGGEDGVVDGLFSFTRPLTGAYYWCPPCDGGRLDLSALGL